MDSVTNDIDRQENKIMELYTLRKYIMLKEILLMELKLYHINKNI